MITFTPNNPTFVDEGTSILPGWALTNATLSQSESIVRLTQTTSSSPGIALHSVTMPVNNKDWCLYAKIRCRSEVGDVQIFQIRHGSVARAHVYLNYNTVTNTKVLGTISMRHISTNGTIKSVLCATGVDLENEGIDCVMHFDRKNLRLELQFKSSDGRWLFKGHCAGSFFGKHIGVMVYESLSLGAWIEWDHFELVAPNFQSIGDSLCKGAPGFSPVLSHNEINPTTSWQYWCEGYPNLRNNLIINKGVGGNTSAMVASRIQADAISCMPKVIFLGFCNNDKGANITYTQRTTNIQSSINACVSSSIKVIGINAVNGTTQESRDYYQGWTDTEQTNLTGFDLIINPMDVLNDGNGYQQMSLTSDGLHNNAAGAELYGGNVAQQVNN